MKPDYPAFLQLSARVAFMLLFYCHNNRPVYLSRVMGPALGEGALEGFDDSVDETLGKILEVNPGEMANLVALRGLAPDFGGLGMRRQGGLSMEKGVLLCRAQTLAYLREFRPELVPVFQDESIWPPIEYGASAGIQLSDEDSDGTKSGDPQRIQKSAKGVRREVEGEVSNVIYDDWGQVGGRGKSRQAELLSRMGAGSTCAFWSSPIGLEGGEEFFPSPHFRAIMRHQLQLPLLSVGGEEITVCGLCVEGGRPRSIVNDPSHPLGCGYTGCWVRRHNDVTDALAKALKTLGLPGLDVRRHQLLPSPQGPEEHVEMDIVLEADGLRRLIDVAVANPGSPKYVTAGSATTELAATATREAQKVLSFRVRMPEVVDVDRCFIPFVVETSGRLGKRPTEFLRSLKLADDAVKRLRRSISMVLARHGGRSLNALRVAR